jgi:hypothetical protein
MVEDRTYHVDGSHFLGSMFFVVAKLDTKLTTPLRELNCLAKHQQSAFQGLRPRAYPYRSDSNTSEAISFSSVLKPARIDCTCATPHALSSVISCAAFFERTTTALLLRSSLPTECRTTAVMFGAWIGSKESTKLTFARGRGTDALFVSSGRRQGAVHVNGSLQATHLSQRLLCPWICSSVLRGCNRPKHRSSRHHDLPFL